ncbi:MAG: type II toxin-antitoxin system VapC family toxin [Chloroflexi bacterium]|nr:type II toxin-antitoxin system VapC family toxin [Chloroflexota bacterium]
MADLLIDTDIFIDHIRRARPIPPTMMGSYSIITRSELFSGDELEEVAVQALLAPHDEVDVGRGIAERAGRLRRTSALSLPDALIAATALEHHLDLVTRNKRHFERVPELRLRDPDEFTQDRSSVE